MYCTACGIRLPEDTDNVGNRGQWPSTQFDHYFRAGAQGPELVIEWTFKPSGYDKNQPVWERNAEADRQAFANLYYQLTRITADGSPAILLETVTTLVDKPEHQTAAVTADEAKQVGDYVLAAWRYLSALLTPQGAADADLPPPVRIVRPTNATTLGVITEIRVACQLRRADALALGDFGDDSAVRVAATPVGPRRVKQQEQDQPEPQPGTYTLSWYARQFQAAFDAPDYQLHLAIGVPRSESSCAPGDTTLWAVRLGKTELQPYWYQLQGQPAFFAPAPLSTVWFERPDVTLYSYTPDGGLSPAPDASRSFTGVDLDRWARSALAGIDQLLAPQYAVPALLVDKIGGTDYLQQVLTTKYKLADAIAQGITNILSKPAITLKTHPTNFAAARETLRQQLLLVLQNAYAIDAIVQHEVAVKAPVRPASVQASDDAPAAPQLYGHAVHPNETTRSKDHLTSAFKMPLQNGSTLLTYAFRTRDPRAQAHVPLTLEYRPTHIERPIASEPGIKEYERFSWLTFIEPLPPIPLGGPTGSLNARVDLDIPIPLRAYPMPPSLLDQSFTPGDGAEHDPAATLEQAKEWTFRCTTARPSALQDRIDAVVHFNVPNGSHLHRAAAEAVDLDVQLARIIHVLDSIQQVFATDLTGVRRDSAPDSQGFQRAKKALAAFAQLVQNLDSVWAAWINAQEKNAPQFEGDLNQTLPFSLAEDPITIEVPQPDGTKEPLEVVRITVAYPTVLPPGIQTPPLVTFDGYTPEEVEPALIAAPLVQAALLEQPAAGEEVGPDAITRKAWIYRQENPQPHDPPYLNWDQAQQLPDRCVNLVNLDVIRYQNAWASAQIIRNQDLMGPDNPTRTPFVYRTPWVPFKDKLTPLLDTSIPINVAQVPTGQTQKRPLAEHLTELLQAFFKGSPSQQQLIELEARYAYALAADAPQPSIELPVLRVPPSEFQIPDDWQRLAEIQGTHAQDTGSVAPAAYVATLADRLRQWFQDATPSPRQAQFRLDLSVFSSLSNNAQPLVRVRNLTLAVADITDL